MSDAVIVSALHTQAEHVEGAVAAVDGGGVIARRAAGLALGHEGRRRGGGMGSATLIEVASP